MLNNFATIMQIFVTILEIDRVIYCQIFSTDKNLANRSRVSCAHSTSMASTLTP